ncbi:MAG: hypothetical protein H6737_25415 [Alphaproteobacteria bacterium]|nr:hypothetical protein [Alphaproteobacteria bacterium]
MDIGIGRWTRDFTLMGAGIGLLAPCVMLGPIAWGSSGEAVVVWALLAACTVGGATVGVGVGTVLAVLTRIAHTHPLLLGLVGFPTGAIAGLVVGGSVGSLVGEAPLVGALGMVTGGLVLGFTWMPYMALKLRGRSGLPVVATAVLASPIMGAVALFTAMVLSNLAGLSHIL